MRGPQCKLGAIGPHRDIYVASKQTAINPRAAHMFGRCISELLASAACTHFHITACVHRGL
jgi:hypothetical protein